jgi:hypothetical protein
MSFLTRVFSTILKKWRQRPQNTQHHIPAKPTTSNLLLLLNPAVMFYTTSVYGNGLKRQIVVPFAGMPLIWSRY